jgi:hypothetical protein
MSSFGPICYTEPTPFNLVVAFGLIFTIPLSYIPQVTKVLSNYSKSIL